VPSSDFKTQYTSHRGETWYELFYDLVFVASALQIGYIVKYDISFNGIIKSGIIFTVMRATWDQLMFYQNKFDTKDMVHFVFYLIQAMLAFVMALHLTLDHDHHWDEERNLKPFALAAALARIAIIVMYFQVMSLTQKYSMHLRLLVLSQGVSAVIFFVSAYASKSDNYYYMWLASIVIERVLVHTFIAVVVPPKKRAPPHFGHLSHRQGTFVLLILGESIIQLVQSSCGQSASAYARGLMGFAIIFNVGDVYYQQQVVGRVAFVTSKSTPYTTLWTALHLILSLGMLFFAVGVKMVYSNECDSHDRLLKEEFFMCVSASVSMIIIFFLRMTHKGIWYKGKRIRGYSYIFRFTIGLMCAFIPYVTHNALSTIGILFAMSSCLVLQV
jgi:low temperature requirement protein LtrA